MYCLGVKSMIDRGLPLQHPGDMLRYVLEGPPAITQERLADVLGVSRVSVSELVNRRRNVTAEMALRLAKATSTSPIFWLNLQQQWDLRQARQKMVEEIGKIQPLARMKSQVGKTTPSKTVKRIAADQGDPGKRAPGGRRGGEECRVR